MEDKKQKYAYWLRPSLVAEMESMLTETNATSKSDFVTQAIKMYIGYLHQRKCIDFISPILSQSIKSEIGSVEHNISKMLFKLSVEQGKLKDVIRNIVVDDCGSKFTIKNQAVIISAPGGSSGVFLLNENTGLLAAKSSKNELSADKSSSSDKEDTVKRECLLNYKLFAGDKVRIVDSELNGTYRIVRGTHEGSRSGAYKTTMEVVPV